VSLTRMYYNGSEGVIKCTRYAAFV